MTVADPIAPLRASRGTAFAGTALSLGVGAHVVAGGGLPGLGAVVFLAVPVVWVSFFLTRAWRGWPTVLAALLAVQAGLHAGLTLLSGPVGEGSPLRMAGEGQMMMSPHVTAMSLTAMPSPAGMAEMPLLPGFGMLAAHVAASVLTGAVLAYGEHLLRSLWTWLHHAITVLTHLIQLPVPRLARPEWLPTVNPIPVLVDRSVRRRGPPRPETRLPALP